MPSGVMSTTWDSFEEVLWSASYSGFIAAHALPSLERIAAFRAHPNAATVTGMLIAQVRRCLPPYIRHSVDLLLPLPRRRSSLHSSRVHHCRTSC